MESVESHIESWKRAADREDREGYPATAITFRNMAWLLEHRDSWIPAVQKTASEQAREYLQKIAQAAAEFEDIT